MTDLRTAAQQALEYMKLVGQMDMYPEEWAIVERLEAALAEDALQRLTDVSQEIEAALAEPCPCGDRSAAQCPGEWEPGCDLGNNPKYAKRVNLAEPVQEPVAWRWRMRNLTDAPGFVQPWTVTTYYPREQANEIEPLYTAPPQRKPLTEEEPQCNPHPKAPHSFMRNASHNEDRYVCECEYWEPYEAGYQAGMEAALRAQS